MKTVISEIAFGDSKCTGQGFSVNVCSDIEIEPNERYDLRIRYRQNLRNIFLNIVYLLDFNQIIHYQK